MYYIYRQNHLVKIVLGNAETEGYTRYATEAEAKELVAENYNPILVKEIIDKKATGAEAKPIKKAKNDTISNTNRDAN